MNIDFPPDFDIQYYRQSYPELNGLPDDVVIGHAQLYAEEQGRSTCILDRAEYLRAFLKNLIDENPIKVLEIGPYDNPTCIGENVKYFDVHDAETLEKLAREEDRPFKNTPKKIHYVEPNGNLEIVDENFDMVFSSHCIEHQPDLINHLQNVEDILNDGGFYVLVVPDKRYCFDHFRNETTLFEVVDAHVNFRSLHTFKSIAEAQCMKTHNNAMAHWFGVHGSDKINTENFPAALNDYTQSVNGGRYVDVHAWCFTPKVFGGIIENLNRLGLINLKLHRLCHTVWCRFEFTAVLKKD